MMAAAATALGVDEPLRDKLVHLAEIPIPVAADCTLIDLRSGEGVERACLVVGDVSRAAITREFHQRRPPGPRNPVVGVLRSGETSLVRRVSEDLLRRMVEDDEAQLETLKRFGPRSYVSVPMRGGGDTFGVFTFAYTVDGRSYTAADVPFFEAFVSAIALPVFALQMMEQASRRRTSSIEKKRPEKKTGPRTR